MRCTVPELEIPVGAEVLQLLADNLVEERLLRFVAPVLGRGAPFRDRRGAVPIDGSGANPCNLPSHPGAMGRNGWGRALRPTT
jgi:hypothetical protein